MVVPRIQSAFVSRMLRVLAVPTLAFLLITAAWIANWSRAHTPPPDLSGLTLAPRLVPEA